MAIVPDDKNWTWVLEKVCPDCGFDAGSVDSTDVAELLRNNVAAWPALLARDDSRCRPNSEQWSALEYGCHVRDVFRLFGERLALMRDEVAPRFANWNQDTTAIEARYDLQNPAVVSRELVAAGLALADAFATIEGGAWQRTGTRSDGASFTIETFASYFLHDPIHHLDDVNRGNTMLGAGRD